MISATTKVTVVVLLLSLLLSSSLRNPRPPVLKTISPRRRDILSAPFLLSPLIIAKDAAYAKQPPRAARPKAPPPIPPLSFEELSLQTISSELNLLKTLPAFYSNNVLSSIVSQLVALKDIQGAELSRELDQLWAQRAKRALSLLRYFDGKRTSLEPVFNENDTTMVTILKATRGESLISELRSQILLLIAEVDSRNDLIVVKRIRSCLFLLGEVGELLNSKFPWADDIPTEGTETLPKLCGRAKVTFSIQRPVASKLPLPPDNFLASLLPATSMTPLGNITIVADGFTAPLTAGNFVDLSRRGFYTGLSVREKPKRVGDIGMNLPLLGSFNDGFNDPFTAKLRTIPLEIIDSNKKNDLRNRYQVFLFPFGRNPVPSLSRSSLLRVPPVPCGSRLQPSRSKA